MNGLEMIMDALKAAGLTVCTPAQYAGICSRPYCVVQQCGGYLRAESRLGGYCRYRVHLIVPQDRYLLLPGLCIRAETALRGLVESGRLKLSQPRSATVVDDRFAAHSCFIEYISEFAYREEK